MKVPELASSFMSVNTTVDQCRKSLECFKAKTTRYDAFLAQGCTKSTVQKVFTGCAKKTLWLVKMKDELARFRAEVMAHAMSLDQLLHAAVGGNKNPSPLAPTTPPAFHATGW
ncbi:hypothetical protein IQ07DRAFT_593356 [Pyrenochaeta sp. DS3sAY3a]|nr:hypothetical protein IQ07DRAFT_593356 [Pyrenochaeta sp. DS3sAY3a]